MLEKYFGKAKFDRMFANNDKAGVNTYHVLPQTNLNFQNETLCSYLTKNNVLNSEEIDTEKEKTFIALSGAEQFSPATSVATS